MRKHQEAVSADLQGANRSRFFDLRNEYKDVKCGSDDNLKDFNSDSSCVAYVYEDGYSSDCSDMSSMRRHSLDLTGKQIRKTRQVLDSKRNSIIVDDCASDTDTPSVTRSEQRKKRQKNHRHSKHVITDYRDCVLNADDKSHKRRSWTDSGVSLSLSRTDQSRCGTFDNVKKGEDSIPMRYLEKSSRDDVTAEIVISAQEGADNLQVPLRRRSASCTQRKSSDSRRSFNRLSQLTNRSSLTNVTILTANSMSSLSSMMSPSELEYFSDSESSDDEDEENNNDIFERRKAEIVKGSQNSVTSTSTVKNTTMESKTSIETIDQPYQKRLEKPSSLPVLRNNLQLKLLAHKSPTKENSPRPVSPRKRGSILKRVKAHFKPRQSGDKNYKDVSSEFSFEKVHNDEQYCEVITTDVLKRLRAEESAHMNTFADEFEYYDEDDLTDDEVGVDPLEKLSSPPVKESKTFIGKFFKKSRSYSISSQAVEKKSQEKKFSRSSMRASVRSNPEISSKDMFLNSDRYTQSSEHLDMKNTGLVFDSKPSRENESDEVCYEYEHDMPRVKSICVSNQHCNTQPIPPGSPLQNTAQQAFDQSQFQSFHSMKNGCNCEECLYADYLDYLQFQRFRRYYSTPCYGPCCMTTNSGQLSPPHSAHIPHQLHLQSPPIGGGGEIKENIVAPLQITKGTEKEAKTFRTSKYESFV